MVIDLLVDAAEFTWKNLQDSIVESEHRKTVLVRGSPMDLAPPSYVSMSGELKMSNGVGGQSQKMTSAVAGKRVRASFPKWKSQQFCTKSP